MTQFSALVLSLLIEVPIVLALGRLLESAGTLRWRRLALVGCAATLITHPFAWHGVYILRAWLPSYWPRVLVVEFGVALVEGLLYALVARMGHRRGQVLSWTANAASFGIGLLLLRVVLS
jgi:uncharacterized protein (DUF486 family)